MINKTILFSILSIILFFTGCTSEVKTLYIWNNYEETSKEYALNNQELEVVNAHLATLKVIIDESKSKNQRVAPGIYAEIGQILYEINKKEEAKKYFLLEKSSYPESSQFIEKVMKKLYKEVK